MNKKVVGLLCGVVVVAGLSGALIALNRTSGTETSSSSTAESSDSAIATVLSNQKAADVVSIAVTNASGSFEVVRTKMLPMAMRCLTSLALKICPVQTLP